MYGARRAALPHLPGFAWLGIGCLGSCLDRLIWRQIRKDGGRLERGKPDFMAFRGRKRGDLLLDGANGANAFCALGARVLHRPRGLSCVSLRGNEQHRPEVIR